MANRLTLQQLRDMAGFLADVRIQATGRYPHATIDALINQEIQATQLLRVEAGTADKSVTTVNTTASDAAQPGGYVAREVVDLPADFMAVSSVYVTSSPNQRTQLQRLTESDKTNDYLYQQGYPRFYEVLDATQTTEARLRLWPRCDTSYTLEISYFAAHPVLSLTTDFWEFPRGADDSVTAAVACRILESNGVVEPNQYTALQNRVARARDAITRDGRRDRGVLTMRNTRDFRRLR